MMKKAYITPTTEVHVMQYHQSLMAGSVTGENVLDIDAGTGLPALSPMLGTDLEDPFAGTEFQNLLGL